MLNEIEILRSMELFKSLNSEELEKIAVLLHPLNVNKGQILTMEGEPAKNFYIIVSGRFKISLTTGNDIVLSHVGDFIGWATIIAAPTYLGTGVALTQGEVLKLSGQDFMRLLISNADLGGKIMKNGSEIVAAGKPCLEKKGS